MKLPFNIADCRLPIAGSSKNRRSQTVNHRFRERGLALVITLILLSVTLVMAIAFLAISRRERNSVSTQTDAATARLAADAALQKAEAQIIANMMGNGTNNNPYNYGLLVSTNYINTFGFVNGIANPTNVNYDYTSLNAPLTQPQFLQNVANLFYDPRPPVFITTNTQTGATDFRFYLDLNRNGLFDDSGWVPNRDKFGNTNGFIPATGDPQWIGILTRPDAPHGPDNFFLSRYAFVAVPVGNTMDLNYIHNQAQSQSQSTADDYFRNESVGTWEINLAAFLADLNTNQWGQIVGSGPGAPAGSATWYQYYRPFGLANSGHAFEDARALLMWRYANNFNSLLPLQAVMGNGNGYNNYANGVIDLYDLGVWMTNAALPFIVLPTSGNTSPWAGSDNTNHFFDLTADLYDSDPAKYPNFVTRLQNASTNVDTYDRYTFYRLLSQLGTDSEPQSDKMNVNYVNITNGVVVPNMETNMIPWTDALAFFTNAADRLLRAYSAQWFKENPSNYLATYYGLTGYNYYYTNSAGEIYTNNPQGLGVSHLTNDLGVPNVLGLVNDGVLSFGLTNIPVLISNKFVYSSSVNRLLQLAANIYDATTNSFYPDVFRPIFRQDFSYNIFVMGYTNVKSVVNSGDMQLRLPIDVRRIAGTSPYSAMFNTPLMDSSGYINVYGIPWIIGVKKSFPNFNEFSIENPFRITRKIQVTRSSAIPDVLRAYTTNQMYIFSLTNLMGAEFWNSYKTMNYTGAVQVVVSNQIDMVLTVNSNPVVSLSQTSGITFSTNLWTANSFFVPFNTNAILLTNSVYYYGPGSYTTPGSPSFTFTAPAFIPQLYDPTNFLDAGIQPLPQINLYTTNFLQVAIIDYLSGIGHVIDYAQLNQMESRRDLNGEIADLQSDGFWNTNSPLGVVNQIYTSRDGKIKDQAEDSDDGLSWSQIPVPGLPASIAGTPEAEQAFFRAFFSSKNTAVVNGTGYMVTNLQLNMQAPFTPTRTRVQYVTWQANDPLVHYMTSDLVDTIDDTNTQHIINWPANLGLLNNRYMPWGGNPNHPASDRNPFNFAIKDALVRSSDDWGFPTNKFPSIGWLGRVHRGTPWQTVYMKATNILAYVDSFGNGNAGSDIWLAWSGNYHAFDAANSAPGQDRILFDLFTTRPNDNAARGQLSVNVEAGNTNDPAAGLAAWSALFSGMAVPTTLTNTYDIINPAGVDTFNSALWQMVTNINYTRAHFTNTDGTVGVFEHVGDIFAAPLLTDQSPFLNWQSAESQMVSGGTGGNLSDELFEWLPQQALSLLKVSKAPRYVIYCYGQTLKPAQNGLVTGSTDFGMCTNYVPVAETAIRVLVHVEDATTSHPHIVVDSYNVLPPD